MEQELHLMVCVVADCKHLSCMGCEEKQAVEKGRYNFLLTLWGPCLEAQLPICTCASPTQSVALRQVLHQGLRRSASPCAQAGMPQSRV